MEGKYCIITYGCQMNESDSERLAGQLEELGYHSVAEPDGADVIIINTCAIRETAEQKVYGKIGELKHLKQEKPDVLIGITGCMAQKNKKALFERAPHLDFVLGPYNIHHLKELVRAGSKRSAHVLKTEMRGANIEDFTDLKAARKSDVFAWVPIMQGCNKFCSYCIVPYVRGREWSRPLRSIVREVEELAAAGYKEITLLGQNVNAYGLDFGDGTNFADVLRAVEEVPGILRMRYMTSHPRDMTREMIDTIAACSKVVTQMHLPVQHGSDAVLQGMNRGYTIAHYRNLADYIRKQIPAVVLTTDLIVGFPGETEEMHRETLALLQDIRYDMAYTFIFSPRSGTPAARMTDKVSAEDASRRLQELMQVQNAISLERNRDMVGQVHEVIVEGPTKNKPENWFGRTSGNKMIIFPYADGMRIGDVLGVRADAAQTWLLRGTPVEEKRS